MRLGLVPYLNVKPFAYGLRALARSTGSQPAPTTPVEVVEDLPARLTPRLRAGELDAAIVPAFDYLDGADLHLLTGTCIGCAGAARSVRLFSQLPLGEIRSIALDSSSHTSAALLRLLCRERFHIRPAFSEAPPELLTMLAEADAALLIGDRAMTADARGLSVTDLGTEWYAWRGLPFVFAVWAARKDDGGYTAELVERALRAGLSAVEEIAARESRRLGLSEQECFTYLTQHMRYELDEPALAGLHAFGELAVCSDAVAEANRGCVWG